MNRGIYLIGVALLTLSGLAIFPFIFQSFSLAKHALVTMSALSLFLIMLIVDGHLTLPRSSSLFYPIAGFTAVGLISSLFSIMPGVSFFGLFNTYQGSLTMVANLLIFSFISIGGRKEWIRSAYYIIAFACLVNAIYTIFQAFGIDPLKTIIYDSAPLAWGFTGNPNMDANYIMMTIPYLIVLPLFMVFPSMGVILSLSRTGIIGLIFLAFYYFQRLVRLPVILFVIPIMLVPSIITIDYCSREDCSYEKNKILNKLSRLTDYVRDPRYHLIKESLPIVAKSPIIGIGPSMFRFYHLRRITKENARLHSTAIYDSTHNNYLDYLITTGILGFLLYIYILIRAWYMSFRFKSIDVALHLSLVAYIFWSFFSFDTACTNPILYMTLGFIDVLYRSNDSRSLFVDNSRN